MSATAESAVTARGPVVLVSQSAFILNTTVRENILFGRALKQDLYERVLDACCLRPDLELLGRSKDLTEIGERGVTLSGGKVIGVLPVFASFLPLTEALFVS